MAPWRDVLGFRPDQAMDFEEAYQRYRQLIVRLAANGCPIEPRALQEAIEEARLELIPPDDCELEPDLFANMPSPGSVLGLPYWNS